MKKETKVGISIAIVVLIVGVFFWTASCRSSQDHYVDTVIVRTLDGVEIGVKAEMAVEYSSSSSSEIERSDFYKNLLVENAVHAAVSNMFVRIIYQNEDALAKRVLDLAKQKHEKFAFRHSANTIRIVGVKLRISYPKSVLEKLKRSE